MNNETAQLQEGLAEIELEAERLLLAKQDLVENDKVRNGNREALTALRKQARTTKKSVPDPCEAIMRELEGSGPKVKEVCRTCGEYDAKEATWMAVAGGDMFVSLPFHAAHVNLEKDQEKVELNAKKISSYIKDKSMSLSNKGALSDRISPQLMKSLVTLKDNS